MAADAIRTTPELLRCREVERVENACSAAAEDALRNRLSDNLPHAWDDAMCATNNAFSSHIRLRVPHLWIFFSAAQVGETATKNVLKNSARRKGNFSMEAKDLFHLLLMATKLFLMKS